MRASHHVLPVVAMGSFPHIYRRAAFPHRATPNPLPLPEERSDRRFQCEELSHGLAHGGLRKVQELQQPKLLVEVSLLHPVIIV